MILLFGRSRFVDEVNQPAERNAVRVVGKVHLARAARRVTIRAGRWKVHVTKGRVGDFRESHTAITRHTAARNAGTGDFVGALAR